LALIVDDAMPTQPKILGILNVTEDSFSDGGKFLGTGAAIAHGRKLMADGADAIDIGAAASNPSAMRVSGDEELARLKPVIAALKAEGAKISVDTFNPEVQRACLSLGVDYLNDIHGFPEPALYPALAKARAVKLIVMHAIQSDGIATREKGDAETIWARILSFFEGRIAALEAAGIARERLILDPGMGMFLGAGREVSFRVLREMERLTESFGLPVLISVSRKSFLRVIAGRSPEEAGPSTLAAELFAAQKGASYIRTHDVRALKDGLGVLAALAGPAG
jgi:dihydropteroate synthase type 2